MKVAATRRMAAVPMVGALVIASAGCGGSDGGVSASGAERMVYQGDANNTVIITIRADGTDKASPTSAVPTGDQTNPDWSPDGERIVFAVSDGNDDLWTVGADGSGAAMLLSCEDPCRYFDDPAWSPDGASVMYQRVAMSDGRRVGTLESVKVADGTVTVWLTAPETDFYSGVRYSPDGRRVVFEQVHTAGGAIDSEILGVTLSILDLDHPEAGANAITDPALFAVTADWGPNGDRIVFSGLPAPDATASDLFTILPDGSGLTRLTTLSDDGGSAEEPAWSADGSAVYFSGVVSGEEGVLAKVSAKGGAVSPAFGTEYDVHGRHPRLHAG